MIGFKKLDIVMFQQITYYKIKIVLLFSITFCFIVEKQWHFPIKL